MLVQCLKRVQLSPWVHRQRAAAREYPAKTDVRATEAVGAALMEPVG